MVKTFLRGINVSFLLFIIISTFSSCANEINIFEGNNNRQINFSVSVPQWKNTDSLATTKISRAMPITDTSFGTDKSFKLIADQNNGTNSYTTLIGNEPVTYSNNLWKTSNDYYWSGITNKTISFYAYYPSTISNVNHTAGSSPTLSYTVPDNVSDQIDIMTSTNNNVSGNTNSSTPLTFNHIFAAIQFSVGSAGIGSGTISSISIGNVANSGTYTFGGGWSNVTGSKTFTISQSKSIAGTSGEDIYSGNYTLMMIPQAFNNITITVTYSNGGTLTKTISGSWEGGKIYTYNLSYPQRIFNYTGNVQTYTVPITGIYKLEVWGAQGSGGGYGGYSYGNLAITQNNQLYICIGSSLGYNGGNPPIALDAYNPGGGASHISTTNRGELVNYKNYQSEILIVAGGGGSGEWTGAIGGSGGGLVGGNSNYNVNLNNGGNSGYQLEAATGGTQTAGGKTASTTFDINGIKVDGSFGQGGYGYSGTDAGGIGGGGWYGGGGSVYVGGGGGGSGYLGSNLISGTSGMNNGVRLGNGYARITFISAN